MDPTQIVEAEAATSLAPKIGEDEDIVPRARKDYKDYKEEEHDNSFYPIGYFWVTADLLFEGGEMSAAVSNIPHRFQHIETVQLLEIDGHPALLGRIRRDIAKMWLFDDDYKNGYRSNTWKEVTIELPFYWEHDGDYWTGGYSVRFHSVMGTDFMFLYLYRCNAIGDGYYFATKVSQYSYNWKKKIFAKIKINGLPSSIPYLNYVSCVSAFVESLSPVK
ncbi:hypothetical protein MKW98_026659 [Papaver atlanticum]|uniref:Uncharacterized protein n=1 Tax=Papaver atlanticum TaxID=357466 RepID=A0AAD4RZP3_9MAGN|nr:hypothetical protein MKW98_026659 [Papaver atlanticum]